LKNEHDEVSLNSFSFDSWLGQGAFGSVFEVSQPCSNERYAMKKMSKKEIIDQK